MKCGSHFSSVADSMLVDVCAGCIHDWRVILAAHRRRRNLFSRMLRQPLMPGRPPRAFLLLMRSHPFIGVHEPPARLTGIHAEGAILMPRFTDNAAVMALVGEHESDFCVGQV